MDSIDLNCDLGESFGPYSIGHDAEILKYISSANIACGFHAGDPMVIMSTIEMALNNDVAIGAHPGFPDLEGFGRRPMHLSQVELYSCVLYQVSCLKGMTEALGGRLNHVKPHGAMYNMAAKDYDMAKTIASAVKAVDDRLLFYGLANSHLVKAAQDVNLKIVNEAFADRRYTAKGHLMPRNEINAVMHDEKQCIEQVLELAITQTAKGPYGEKISIKADSICLHGDNLKALEMAKAINEALKISDITIKSLKF